MKALAFPVLILLAALSVASPIFVRNRIETAHLKLENIISAQSAEISKLSKTNSSGPAATSAPQLSTEEMRELLRLRSEVGRLRDTVAETEKLRAAQSDASTATASRAADKAGPNYWPADKLGNVGFSTPEAAAQTVFWILKNGDMNAMLACAAPDVVAEFRSETDKNGVSPAVMQERFKSMAQQMTGNASAYRIFDKQTAPDGTVTLKIGFEGDGVTEDVSLKQFGPEWKILDFGNPKLIEE